MKIKVYPWPNQPTKIAIFTGITCNLACLLCGPGASSRWRSELGLGKFYDLDTELDNYDFSKIEHVTFTGGEPLLNETTLEILRRLNPDANIHFHSNGTVLPTPDYLEQFSRFEKFLLVFSIDDIEQQFEYLRWPAKWSDVANNIIWFREHAPENVRFGFNVVVSKLNQESYHRVQNWMNQNLPQNKIGVESIFYTNETNGLLHRTEKLDNRDPVEFLNEIDSRRGTDWKKVFPLVKL